MHDRNPPGVTLLTGAIAPMPLAKPSRQASPMPALKMIGIPCASSTLSEC
ncbi:MAG: hypothetical protein AAFX78_14590 [Cyanobacteria bacterium J06638_20]